MQECKVNMCLVGLGSVSFIKTKNAFEIKFSETLCVNSLRSQPQAAGTAESSRLQYTVNSTFSLNCKVQPSCNDKKSSP
jgi:hypothetical protein